MNFLIFILDYPSLFLVRQCPHLYTLTIHYLLQFVKKKIRQRKHCTCTEVLRVTTGGNLSEERFSPRPPSKDFQLCFLPLWGSRFAVYKKRKLSDVTPIGAKTELKVLGKEFEEQPFFKRVFLNNYSQYSRINTVLTLPGVHFLSLHHSSLTYCPFLRVIFSFLSKLKSCSSSSSDIIAVISS